MIRVFLDANVLFSAAWRPDSGLMLLWERQVLHLVTSPYAIAEAERNLVRKRPDAAARLEDFVRRVEITAALGALDDEGHGLPPKDIPILAGAVASHCTVLVTGDIADFGRIIGHTWQGVRILTASMVLAEL